MKGLFACLFVSATTFISAQNYVHQVYVLNEGYFDYVNNSIIEPVTLGSYNPLTQVYITVDTIENMRFGSDIVIEGDFVYVAADSKILKYNKYSNSLMGSIDCPGVRNLGVYQNKLVATRGEYLTTYDSYLHVYDVNSLQLIVALDTVVGPKWAAQNVVIDGSNAYIAINNGYEWGNEKGIIGMLNLNTLQYGNEIDLGPEGKNPDNLVKYGSNLYTVNNKDWSGASVSRVDLSTQSSTTATISSAVTGCGTSCLRNGTLVYQISGENLLNEWNILTMNPVGPVANIAMNFYEISEDVTNNLFYASNTDYLTYGTVYVYDASNTLLHSFSAGVSPGTISFDVRQMAGLTEGELFVKVYPNPTQDQLHINAGMDGIVTLFSSNGATVMSQQVNDKVTLSLAHLEKGIYTIRFTSDKGVTSNRIVIQ